MTPTIKLFDVVALTTDLPDRALRADQAGPVVESLGKDVSRSNSATTRARPTP